MSNFFIAGLPRSRTAWFAAYFSAHPDVFCYHEALKGCIDPAEFQNKMEGWSAPTVGNSDSGLPLCNLEVMFPDAPVVIIERRLSDCVFSLMTALNIDNPPQAMLDMLEACNDRMAEMEGLRVRFEDIDDRMVEISQWLGIPYREDIHDLFKPLNITTIDLEGNTDALEWLPFA